MKTKNTAVAKEQVQLLHQVDAQTAIRIAKLGHGLVRAWSRGLPDFEEQLADTLAKDKKVLIDEWKHLNDEDIVLLVERVLNRRDKDAHILPFDFYCSFFFDDDLGLIAGKLFDGVIAALA